MARNFCAASRLVLPIAQDIYQFDIGTEVVMDNQYAIFGPGIFDFDNELFKNLTNDYFLALPQLPNGTKITTLTTIEQFDSCIAYYETIDGK